MQLFIDDAEVQHEVPTAGTLEETVRFVQSDVCPPGRLIVRLRYNGDEVKENQMTGVLKTPANSCQRLELFTGTPEKLVAEAMEQASAALSNSEEASRDAAGLLTEGDSRGGIKALGECIGIWQQIHEAVVKSIQMLEIDPNTTRINELPLADAIGKPGEVLLQIKRALEMQDHVQLADVLIYELHDATELWKAILAELHTQAVQKREKG
ncbi:MAG: hypothetical protein ACE5E5_02390 [Phycisphaerae bacterium]